MVYDWADQQTLADVTDNCKIDEGIVVKMFMSVNRKRQNLQDMATFVGDNALAERLAKM